MDLDGITLGEISQTKKEKYRMISLSCKVYTQARENTSSKKQNRVVVEVGGGGEGGSLKGRHREACPSTLEQQLTLRSHF